MSRRRPRPRPVLPSIVVDLAYPQRDLLAYLTLRGLTASDVAAVMGWKRQKAQKFVEQAKAGKSVLSESLAEFGAAVGVRAQWVAVRPEDDPEALRRKVVKAELDKLRTAYVESVMAEGLPDVDRLRASQRHLRDLILVADLSVRLGYLTEQEKAEYLAEPKKDET